MFNSTRGNSFRITKKVLCVVMAVSLSLMMLPSALFRTQAEAAPAATDDVFVKADSDMTNFGQFAYNPNSNAANISTYTQNDLLNAIGCKAETEESLHEQVANEVKAFLIENQFSPVYDVFPAAKEGYQLTGTSIASVTSQLTCLTATYDKATGKAKFVTSAPANSAQNGVVIITAEYAKLVADYDIVFSSLTTDLNAAKELQINTKTCEGMITITPTANKDTNGKTIYKLTVDTAIKNINKLANNYNVSVNVDTTKSGEPVVVDNGVAKADLSTIIGSQDMREVSDMKTKLVDVVKHSEGIEVTDSEGNATTVYLGVVDAHKDSILSSTAYSVKNEAINNVVINTKSGAEDIFALFTDEARTQKSEDPDITLVIENPHFNINAPEGISSADGVMTFYDGDEDVAVDPADIFVSGNVKVKGTESAYSIADAGLTNVSFSQEINQLTLKNTASSNVKKGSVFTKNISSGQDPVIKVFVNDFTFETSNGYKGFEVTDSSGNELQKILDFFFHSASVKINFKFDSTVAQDYDILYVSSKSD